MLNITSKYKKTIISCFILVLILLISIITLYFNNTKTVLASPEEKEIVEEVSKKIRVDIKGAVTNPGVYELDENSRIMEVINMAGGLIEGANTSLINLSKKIVDEMVIIIYTNDEIENYKQSKIKTEYIYETEYVYIEVDSCPDKVNQACINEYKEPEQTNTEQSNKININTASADSLTTLSGIGNSKAQAIIDYRNQNGNFKDISELSNVTGIGNSIIEKIKDNITI